jgi:hypothetical protein
MDPSNSVAVWFTNPPGAVIQYARHAPGSVALAEWIAGPARAAFLERFPGDGPVVFVLDLGLMKGRDPVARPIVTAAVRSLKDRIERAVLVPPEEATAVYLASLQASISLLRVFGVSVSIETLPDALRSLEAAE